GDTPSGSPPQPAPTPEPPAADAPLPRDPGSLAAALETTTTHLYAAIDKWIEEGDPARGEPPEDVAALAASQQRIYLRLGRRPRLARRTIAALPRPLVREARDNVRARRALSSIRSVVRYKPKIRIGPAQPAGRLLRHYRRAWRRFDVGWPLLAAVNFVESAFGRMRNRSVSGARGPMQFMPATWEAYGMGGNVRDPRDAILGAANYLSASGAPGDERGALYAYNPSPHYVRAISIYARRIRDDHRAFYAYYAWRVRVR
ncbi:MAG: transglycosylase SLT domain-containing protein, partial [Solirubrobacteraceae bacterium]